MLFLSIVTLAIAFAAYLIFLGLGIGLPPVWLQGNRASLIFGTIILVVALAVGIVRYAMFSTIPPLVTAREAILSAQAQIVAAGLRVQTKLPNQLDPLLRLEDITAEHTSIIYRISILAHSSDEFFAIANEIKQNMEREACKRDDYRKMLAFGFSVEMRFAMPNGPEAKPLTFTPRQCGL